ncbi:Os04g0601200, partial [Oryza sativa Japonica Group]
PGLPTSSLPSPSSGAAPPSAQPQRLLRRRALRLQPHRPAVQPAHILLRRRRQGLGAAGRRPQNNASARSRLCGPRPATE